MKVTHIVIVQMKMKEGNIVNLDVSEDRARKVFNTGQNPEEHHSSGGMLAKNWSHVSNFYIDIYIFYQLMDRETHFHHFTTHFCCCKSELVISELWYVTSVLIQIFFVLTSTFLCWQLCLPVSVCGSSSDRAVRVLLTSVWEPVFSEPPSQRGSGLPVLPPKWNITSHKISMNYFQI